MLLLLADSQAPATAMTPCHAITPCDIILSLGGAPRAVLPVSMAATGAVLALPPCATFCLCLSVRLRVGLPSLSSTRWWYGRHFDESAFVYMIFLKG